MPVSSRSRVWPLRLMMALIMVLVTNPTAAFSPAAQETATGSIVNVELIFDSSGSMAQEVAPGVTRIQAAKDVLNEVVEAIPEQEGINVGRPRISAAANPSMNKYRSWHVFTTYCPGGRASARRSAWL